MTKLFIVVLYVLFPLQLIGILYHVTVGHYATVLGMSIFLFGTIQIRYTLQDEVREN